MLSLGSRFSVLHVFSTARRGSNFPGIVVAQDSFATPNPASDATVYPQTKFLIQGGGRRFPSSAGYSRVEEYWGARYRDVKLCITVATPATDKAEGQVDRVASGQRIKTTTPSWSTRQMASSQLLKSSLRGNGVFPLPGLPAPQSFGHWQGKFSPRPNQGENSHALCQRSAGRVIHGYSSRRWRPGGFDAESGRSATSTDTFDFTDFAVAATDP